jgi:flagellar M-ring protein FliF
VVSMPFVDAMESVDTGPAARPGNKMNGDLVTFVQMVAFGVVGFGIIILTARSIFAALTKQPAALSIAGGGQAQIGPGGTAEVTGQAGGALAIEHSSAEAARNAAAADDDETMNINNIQGQLRASSIRKVLKLVDQHPDTTLGIIRSWLSTDPS